MRREHLLLHAVDVPLDRVGDGQVLVDDVVGHRMQHRRRAERELLRIVLEALAHAGQSGVFAVSDGDDEISTDHHHDLAALDDLVRRRHRFVFDVLDRA